MLLHQSRWSEYQISALFIQACIAGIATMPTILKDQKMSIKKESWGKTTEGKEIFLYTLDNGNGVIAGITNFGGIVTFLKVSDKNGQSDDVLLGYDSLQPYLEEHPYFGALVGRYANRIAGGKFSLDGKETLLARNNGPNHLHGGIKGFDKAIWQAEEIRDNAFIGLKLSHLSPSGEEGYPGNLKITVLYALTKDNELKIAYEAETDMPTPVNLTFHGYFNLKGAGNGNMLGHQMMIRSDRYTVVDDQLIPTGELRPVAGTPFDFTHPVAVGDRIDRVPGGYDHNFVLTKNNNEFALAATVFEPESGRSMDVYTTEPGLQFYSGNFLDGSLTGKDGKVYQKHSGFCLEAQHFPDSPNQPFFPNVILKPGEKYTQLTVYRFY